MNWTNIPKPSTTSYTTVAFQGKEYYDDHSVTYDSASTYYDTIWQSQWTNVAKPAGKFTTTPGMATGLIMSPTYTQKTTTTSWTNVAKPT